MAVVRSSGWVGPSSVGCDICAGGALAEEAQAGNGLPRVADAATRGAADQREAAREHQLVVERQRLVVDPRGLLHLRV
ncbi:hypothetical protein XH97_31330 [Bradyrhizobium sp. CCBAU 53380]|nr:hypothetical protein [Bradyrhizobium sp. CCBAU 53380]